MITFDTHKYVTQLRDAGVSEEQASVQATVLAEALKDGADHLATREDITRIEGDIKLLRWMSAFTLAICIALLWLLIRSGI